MSIIPYTKRMLTQRIQKHVNDGNPDDAFSVSTNEVMLYADQALAQQIKVLAYENARVEGVIKVPEAFMVTYKISGIAQDPDTGYWSVTLPQTPISLPLGYSVAHVYFANTAIGGRSDDALPIKNNRLGYRKYLPTPKGIFYWVEGTTLWLWATNNSTLLNQNVFVQLPVTRTDDLDAPMNLPDDIIENIFNDCIKQILNRYSIPTDIVSDDLPAGKTNINSRQ